MAFNLNSITNNALQLQMQQMLANVQAAQQMNATAAINQSTIPPNLHLATMTSTMINNNATGNKPDDFINNKNTKQGQTGIIPMDLENETVDGQSMNPGNSDATVDVPEKVPTGIRGIGLMPNNDMIFGSMLGIPNQVMHQSQFPIMMAAGMMDPTLLNMQQLSMVQQMNQLNHVPSTSTANETSGSGQIGGQIKELIQCKSCTLFPPNPNAPKPTTREKPPGCRTVFVGGLPDNITEQMIHEIFERCGEITTLRLSKKNFCHIRFQFEASVESAIYLSGYRIKISGNNTDASGSSGRLHVDYAQARDDQYEYECKQRQLEREKRHREKMEKDRLRPLSPPKIVHYSENEASNLVEKIKNDDTFLKACQILCTWLERGDCNKKNSNVFYTIIQSTNSHVRRLLNERSTIEQDFKTAKEKYKKQKQLMVIQFNQIEKLFSAASHKKVWDHFSKAQRKNIDNWKKSLETSSSSGSDKSDDDVMEISDDESHDSYKPINKKAKFDNDKLKEENDSLRCQLRACKSEVELLKTDNKSDSDIRDKQIKVLHETIQNLQTQLLASKKNEIEVNNKISELETKLKEANVKELLLKTKIASVKNIKDSTSSGKGSDNEETNIDKLEDVKSESENQEIDEKCTLEKPNKKIKLDNAIENDQQYLVDSQITTNPTLDLAEGKIIGLASTFLAIHPATGVRLIDIWSYINNVMPNVKISDLSEILYRYNNLFEIAKVKENERYNNMDNLLSHGELKWRFCGLIPSDISK